MVISFYSNRKKKERGKKREKEKKKKEKGVRREKKKKRVKNFHHTKKMTCKIHHVMGVDEARNTVRS